MKKLLLFVTCIFFCTGTDAQINIVEDGLVQAMIQRHKETNRSMTVAGWRVQLAAGTDRNMVTSTKSKFLSVYPEFDAEWTYKAPYYKLNTGAFLTKLEAARLKYKIRKEFPNAYIIRDEKIKPSEFMRY